MFRYQKVYCFLWYADLANGGFCLRTGQGQFSVRILDILLADEYGSVLDIEVRPEERGELALAQSADQLQIEHGDESSLVSGIQIVFDVLRLEDLHLEFLNFWSDAVFSWIAQDQALFGGSFEGVVQHQVKASHSRAAESWIAMTALAVDATVFHQIFVKLLDRVRPAW